MLSEQEIKKAIEVILSDRKAFQTSLNFAIGYSREALLLHGEELRIQCGYILNNITHWRHPEAKNVRKTLKEFYNQIAY